MEKRHWLRGSFAFWETCFGERGRCLCPSFPRLFVLFCFCLFVGVGKKVWFVPGNFVWRLFGEKVLALAKKDLLELPGREATI